eukprot:g31013.t1
MKHHGWSQSQVFNPQESIMTGELAWQVMSLQLHRVHLQECRLPQSGLGAGACSSRCWCFQTGRTGSCLHSRWKKVSCSFGSFGPCQMEQWKVELEPPPLELPLHSKQDPPCVRVLFRIFFIVPRRPLPSAVIHDLGRQAVGKIQPSES